MCLLNINSPRIFILYSRNFPFLTPQIPEKDKSIITACSESISHFVVVFYTANWTWRFKNVDWFIWVLDIPNIGIRRHFIRHLLKPLYRITDSNFRVLRLPGNHANWPLNILFVSLNIRRTIDRVTWKDSGSLCWVFLHNARIVPLQNTPRRYQWCCSP